MYLRGLLLREGRGKGKGKGRGEKGKERVREGKGGRVGPPIGESGSASDVIERLLVETRHV